MIKDLLCVTESSSVGSSSTSGFSAEIQRQKLSLYKQGPWFHLIYCTVFSVPSCGYSKLTLGGDGQYCIVVSIAALSHCIESIDREIVGGGSLQASNCECCCTGRKHVHVQKAG